MRVNPVVALNFALRFIKPLAIKGRLLNQCHLLDESNGDPVDYVLHLLIFMQQQGK
jgi:hypothetical protein